MGVMLVFYAAVLLNAGRNNSRSIVAHIRVRVRRDDLLARLRTSEAALVEAQSLARVGSWELDLVTGAAVWSAEMFRIVGEDPATTQPSVAAVRARVHVDDLATYEKEVDAWLETGRDTPSELRIVMDDGAIKWIHQTHRTTRDAQARPVRLIGVVQDVTERKVAEQRLALASMLLKTLMDASPNAIMLVDTNTRIISFNERFSDISGVLASDLTEEKRALIMPRLLSTLKSPQELLSHIEYLGSHPSESSHSDIETNDGRIFHRFTAPVHTPDGAPLGRAWFFTDITEDRRALAQALRMARVDGLTGLVNRAAFIETVEHGIAMARRGAKGFAVLSIDLDRFKDVNDTLGRAAGDELLKAVAERLRSTTRKVDTVARFGADEFAVIATDLEDAADVAVLADKLIEAIDQPFLVQGGEVHTGASIGFEVYRPEYADAEALISHADVALARAKSEGRGSSRFFNQKMDEEMRRRVILGAELRKAIARDELFLVFQPQVSLADGSVTGVEALARWRHPTFGLIGPDVFIALAERMGLIVEVGRWVLWSACRQAMAWVDAAGTPMRMCVNLSALQFQAPLELEADIAAVLAETGLPPQSLELELTESVIMTVSREHDEVLQRLRGAGVTVAIDDFGTGYSSLDYLRRLPVDRIKIAQEFVSHLETMPRDGAIVKATIGLANALRIAVIAEGVETRAQSELLKGWGCGEAQGYYFARPLAVDDVTRLLRGARQLVPAGET